MFFSEGMCAITAEVCVCVGRAFVTVCTCMHLFIYMRVKGRFLDVHISIKLLSIHWSVCVLEGKAKFYFSANLTVAILGGF